jgi:hypothetical protein
VSIDTPQPDGSVDLRKSVFKQALYNHVPSGIRFSQKGSFGQSYNVFNLSNQVPTLIMIIKIFLIVVRGVIHFAISYELLEIGDVEICTRGTDSED